MNIQEEFSQNLLRNHKTMDFFIEIQFNKFH